MPRQADRMHGTSGSSHGSSSMVNHGRATEEQMSPKP